MCVIGCVCVWVCVCVREWWVLNCIGIELILVAMELESEETPHQQQLCWDAK